MGDFFTVENISYTYPGSSAPALRGVDLSIPRGGYVAVAGPNGSGKTTLALILAGMLEPDSGNVLVGGMPPASAARRVALVFQNPEDQLVASAVEDDVAFGPENLGLAPREIRRRVEEALDLVGLSSLADRDVHELSVGQQQLLALAGALALEPECLVLDEATAMLDPEATRNLLDVLDGLKARGVTLVSITHRMEEILRAERAVVVADGRIALEATPRELFADDRLAGWGLGLPAVSLLGRALADALEGLDAGAATVEELAARLVEYAP